MKKIALYSSLFSLSIFNAFAQDSFTSELDAGYAKVEDAKTYGVSGQYFFSPVDTAKGPLAEAVFLNRANAVRAGFSRNETEFFGTTFSANFWNIGGTYHFSDTGFFLDADIAQLNGSDAGAYGLSAGYYLGDDWNVTVGTSFNEDFEYTNFSITTKKLIDLGGDTHLNLAAAINDPDEGSTSYAVDADYYFNSRVSVGLSHSWVNDFGDGVTFLSAKWFATDSMAISAGVGRFDSGRDTDTGFELGITARF